MNFMNKFLILLTLSLTVLFSSCIIAKPKVLGNMAGYPRTEAIRIPKQMLRIAGCAAEDESGLLRSLNSLEVITCEDRRSMPILDSEFERIVNERGLELLVSSTDSLESVDIYAEMNSKNTVIKELLIRDRERKEQNFIYLKGKFDLGKLLESDPKSFTRF